jgi:ABC-type multidrug transport system fused ATPase/permease subunit
MKSSKRIFILFLLWCHFLATLNSSFPLPADRRARSFSSGEPIGILQTWIPGQSPRVQSLAVPLWGTLTRRPQRLWRWAADAWRGYTGLWSAPEELTPAILPVRKARLPLLYGYLADAFLRILSPLAGQELYRAAFGSQAAIREMVVASGLFLAAETLDPFRWWLDERLADRRSALVLSLHERLLALGIASVDPLATSEGLGSRIYLGAEKVAQRLLSLPIELTGHALHAALAAGVLGWRDPLVALVCVLLASGLALWQDGQAERLARLDRLIGEAHGRAFMRLEELFAGPQLRQVRASNLEAAALAGLHPFLRRANRLARHRETVNRRRNAVVDKTTSLFLVSGLTLFLLWRRHLYGSPDIGAVTATLALSWHIYYRIGTFLSRRKAWLEADETMRQLLRRPARRVPAVLTPARTDAAVEATDLSLAVGSRILFERLSFVVRPGSILLVTGDSGAGKTTLLRIVAGLQSPDKGRVLVDGRSPERMRDRLAFVTQEVPWLSGVSVGDNLRRWAPAVSEAAIGAALRDVGWSAPESLLGESIDRLSGGERQAVAVAAAWLRQPAVWLLDEPTSALDSSRQASIERLLTRAASQGAALIIATHRRLALSGANELRLGTLREAA